MNAPERNELKRRKVQTLDTLTPSQIDAIRSIPSHEASNPDALLVQRPVSIFLDDAHFSHEQKNVFRTFPVVVSCSALLAEPGSAMAVDSYGVPVLLMRDKEGTVRAFLNACQHKGAKVIEDCAVHKTNKVMCPYHAWTYGLDGKLAGVPREETFDRLDKSQHNLVALPVREAGGLIWVILDRQADPDFSLIEEQVVQDFEAFGLGDMYVYGRKQFDLKANWKLVLEPFLEGYHVQRLHAKTVGPLFADVPNVTHTFGKHIRQISGKADFTPEDLNVAGENIHKTITHAYQVFPNTVIVTSPYYISVMILAPRAADRTVVDYHMLVHGKPDSAKAEELYSKSYEMILNVFGNEDFRAAESCHEGLSTGALERTTYCGMEETIPLYYGILEDCL